MQILFSQSNSPTLNLASEEYLFSERTDDLLFLYVNEPSVIIGCNQAIRNEVDLDFCLKNDIQIVRRMSGGGAVFHDFGNLNFCFISNKINGESSLNNDFLQPIVAVLNEQRVPVTIGKRKDLWLENNYKITGTASHVGKSRELHHGTLLYNTNIDMLEQSLSSKECDTSIKAIVSVRSTVKNVREWLTEQGQSTLDAIDFFKLSILKLQQYYRLEKLSDLNEREITQIEILSKVKYCSTEWTCKK